jgi:hypothetical protein
VGGCGLDSCDSGLANIKDNGPFGSIEGEKCLGYLRDYLLLKKNSAP